MTYTLGKGTLYFIDKDGNETSFKANPLSKNIEEPKIKKCKPPPFEFSLEDLDASFLNSLTEWLFAKWMKLNFKDMWE